MEKSIYRIFVATFFLLASNYVSAVGTWDQNESILGLNPNQNWQTSDTVAIKKGSTGSSGCDVVKFRPGYGNLPNDSIGIEARDRIYATALSAYMSGKTVSIWVYDTANCYGLMLIIGDVVPF